MIYKFLTQEISINSVANNVSNNQIIRVVNLTNSNNTLLIQHSNGVTYCSGSVRGNSEIVVVKSGSDLLIGAGMVATAIAYKN